MPVPRLRKPLLLALLAVAVPAAEAAAQIPGQTPGRTPGPGQTPAPGQTPGRTPGQTPGQTPGAGQTPPPGNRAPVCPDSIELRIPKDGSFFLTSNCSDPDGQPVSYAMCATCAPKHLGLDLQFTGARITGVTLVAEKGYTGRDSFSYFASDGFRSSNVTTVDVRIQKGLDGSIVETEGTNRNDTLLGSAANDLINGGGGNDNLSGGRGKDTLSGGAGNDTVKGGAGDDTLTGGPGSDTLDGGGGRDLIGDPGKARPRQFSGVASAAARKKGNRVRGGPGKDLISVRNGLRDSVDCGPGRDGVRADRADIVAKNCERVSRPK
jgi:Ca2+-binding RTX toxin-like protein